MLENETDRDHTRAMRAYAKRRVAELAEQDLCGYVLKKDSPSCGMERVQVYRAGAPAVRDGRGLFAEALLAALPSLPVEEEGRLHDAPLRENFIERVFAYRRLRDLFASDWRLGDVVGFHTAHKLQLMAHAPKAYAELGRLVARHEAAAARGAARRATRRPSWRRSRKRATPGRNANVLEHMAGYLSERLDAAERARARGPDPRPPRRPRAAGRPAHAGPPPRAPLRRRVSAGAGLPRPPPQGADAAQPRVGATKRAASRRASHDSQGVEAPRVLGEDLAPRRSLRSVRERSARVLSGNSPSQCG